jgi:hypothetical protein
MACGLVELSIKVVYLSFHWLAGLVYGPAIWWLAEFRLPLGEGAEGGWRTSFEVLRRHLATSYFSDYWPGSKIVHQLFRFALVARGRLEFLLALSLVFAFRCRSICVQKTSHGGIHSPRDVVSGKRLEGIAARRGFLFKHMLRMA